MEEHTLTQRLAAHKRAMGVVWARRNERTRWVLTRVPNESFAQQAGMDQAEAFQAIMAGFMAELQHSTDQAGEPN